MVVEAEKIDVSTPEPSNMELQHGGTANSW